MDALTIYRRNNNREILAKLMNSFAARYDCSVKYNAEEDCISFTGDEAHKVSLANEIAYLFEGH